MREVCGCGGVCVRVCGGGRVCVCVFVLSHTRVSRVSVCALALPPPRRPSILSYR